MSTTEKLLASKSKSKTKTNAGRKKAIEKPQLICLIHPTGIIELPENRFYVAKGDNIYSKIGKILVCKDCCARLFQDYYLKYNDEKLATYYTCRKLDIAFINGIYESAYEESGRTWNKVFGLYMKTYSSLGNVNGLTSCFDSSDDYTMTADETMEEKEDKKMEKRKYNETWMGTYSKTEIKYLDDYLENLKSDFNIITTNHIDYAKKIAKASLIMDKEYEKIINGEGSDASYEKYKRIYDDLCKSAQFAESGRGKTAVGNGISEIVELVENKQWIFKRDDYEKDDIDLLLAQFANISKSL